MSKKSQALGVLLVSTLAFTVCFMVWMMFGVIGIPIKKTLGLNATEFGLLTATPVLTGSLIRVPLGIWTDKYGGRIVLFSLMMCCVIPIWLIGYATLYWHFLVLGLFALCIAYRWAAVLLGLTLAATCVICAIEFLRDPNMGDNAFTGILFLPWAGFGLWLGLVVGIRPAAGASLAVTNLTELFRVASQLACPQPVGRLSIAGQVVRRHGGSETG